MSAVLPNKNINITTHTVSFLGTRDLVHFSQVNRAHRALFRKDLAEREFASEKLIINVYNAKPKKIEEFLKYKHEKGIILKKTCFKEGYYSTKLQKFVLFKEHQLISPLQAAAIWGDNFIVLDLLSYIAKDHGLRLAAAQQLKEVLNNKEKYLASFKFYLKACEIYATHFPGLYDIKEWEMIEQIMQAIGLHQQRFPRYGLQEFFDRKPFDPIPEFDTAPSREDFRFTNGGLLDLDDLGAMKKGHPNYAFTVSKGRNKGVNSNWRLDPESDALAISRLCELRPAELKHIIVCLQENLPLTLRKPEKSTAAKP